MKELDKAGFDPAVFLANAGLGRKIVHLKAKETFFSQGNPGIEAIAPKGEAGVHREAESENREEDCAEARTQRSKRKPLRKR
jgi:hypothetical protein